MQEFVGSVCLYCERVPFSEVVESSTEFVLLAQLTSPQYVCCSWLGVFVFLVFVSSMPNPSGFRSNCYVLDLVTIKR
jgi:hypothetical protein